jgi:UDP-N-acetylmuramate dehydrogenase
MEIGLLNHLKSKLKPQSIPFRENLILSTLCSFRIGGTSPLVVEPENTEQLITALSLFRTFSIPFKVLGGGTNLLISDFPDDFVTLRLAGEFKEFQTLDSENGLFRIGSAASTTPTFRKISQSGYTGTEFLSTIPGWVGGAVIQNAGCYGGELFDFIHRVEYVQGEEICSLQKSQIEYGYRYTQFLKSKNAFISFIEMQIPKGNLDSIEISLKEKRDKRNASQPQNKKSAGSVFKNPPLTGEDGKPLKAWYLIDQVGLRGLVKGDAQISPEHCNFIVNLGKAKASDVHYLIQVIQEKVFSQFGIPLEREVEFFGRM